MGKFIAALRRANGMTQSELAEKLFVSDKAVSRWERDESMPDITLVPLLANIFGVTADEILCGERITMPFASDTTENGSSVRDVLRKQEENQLEKQLKQRLTHFKMMSAVSVGITLFCLLIAAVCLLAFDAKKLNEAVLGGCIALTGVLVAIVYQICVTYSSLFVDGNDEKTVQVRLYNGRLASTAKNYFLFLLFCLGGSIPIFSAQRNPDGIDNGNYNFALICIALALGFVFATIGYFVYRLRIEKSLAKSGKITFDKKEITIKSLKNKYTLPCFFIAVGLIAACVVSLAKISLSYC